jgi:uncharacterized zinc-type alcohol dehydrogenase-like protein
MGADDVTQVLGYAAHSAETPLGPFRFERRRPGATDVQIDILFCGVCHSDLHIARNEWNGTTYPVVPGHEIVGRVAEIGAEVQRFKVGDLVGVGCLVDSCRRCISCDDGLEQHCEHSWTPTYGGYDRHTGGVTHGGYSQAIVVDEHFVLRIPEGVDPAAAAPLLCAGITVYSPLRQWRVEAGQKVGVVGLGGLGHMAIKIARAMGAEVVLFTTSPGKVEDARRLGAHDVVLSCDMDAMARHANSFDFILNTVAAAHHLDPFLSLLKRDATMTLVGAPADPHPSVTAFNLIFKRRRLAGSMIGGIAETQEMLDFCAAHGIVSEIELIPIQSINDAFERMLGSDVRYRFVIDMGSLRR